MGNPTPIMLQKKLTHVITNIFIFKGDLAETKEKLTEQGKGGIFKSLRFMSLNKDYSLAIQYQETIKGNSQDQNGAVFGVKIIRESEIKDNERKRKSSQTSTPDEEDDFNFDDIETNNTPESKILAKGIGFGHTWDLIPIITQEEFLTASGSILDSVSNGRSVNFSQDNLKNIYGFDASWNSENLYLVCTRKRQRVGDEPLNEIHLLSVSRGAGIKIPNGYSPATEIVFHKGDSEKYLLIARESNPPFLNF